MVTTLPAIIRQEDVAARYGPDEFMILLPHTDLKGGQALRDRIQHCTAEALSAQRPELKVSITVGVCQYSGAAMETFIAGAEQALLRAKRGGDDDELSVPVYV